MAGDIAGPRPRRCGIEQVDDVRLDGDVELVGERVEARALTAADADLRAFAREPLHDRRAEVDGAPATAITRPSSASPTALG